MSELGVETEIEVEAVWFEIVAIRIFPQPTREDSNSNIFEQNYFFFDFYFCTPKNMETDIHSDFFQTDAQLYTIIWTLTKEEKITYKIAIFGKNKCQNLV